MQPVREQVDSPSAASGIVSFPVVRAVVGGVALTGRGAESVADSVTVSGRLVWGFLALCAVVALAVLASPSTWGRKS